MTTWNQDIISLLEKQMRLLQKSQKHLAYSYEKCRRFELAPNMNDETYESLDSMASRFARTAELLFKQVLRSVMQLLEEYPRVAIDQANKGEQLDLITSAKDMLAIRQLRNQIVHEYSESEWLELYSKILKFTPILVSLLRKGCQIKNGSFGDIFIFFNHLIHRHQPISKK